MGDEAKHFPPRPVVQLRKVLDVVKLEGLVVVENLHDTWESLPDVLGTEGDAIQ